jgi:hypothetical protein
VSKAPLADLVRVALLGGRRAPRASSRAGSVDGSRARAPLLRPNATSNDVRSARCWPLVRR